MESWLENFANVGFRRSADTAHDLKTPLNIAVLNLELLRMRARKLAADGDDPKITGYASAIDMELRRLARIFDAYFVYATPPPNGGPYGPCDLKPLFGEAMERAGMAWECGDEQAVVECHEARARELAKQFVEGAARLFSADGPQLRGECAGGRFVVTATGVSRGSDVEIGKLFKFYYTDPDGNADLSLATARLIAETYAGTLEATEEGDRIRLTLSLPSGGR